VPLRELELGDTLIPLKALQVAEELLREQANGQDPDVIVLGEEITAQDAADMLGVSRTHLNAPLERDRSPGEGTDLTASAPPLEPCRLSEPCPLRATPIRARPRTGCRARCRSTPIRA
jgi:hypothetical protein